MHVSNMPIPNGAVNSLKAVELGHLFSTTEIRSKRLDSNADRLALLEVIDDPNVPNIPPHISFEQMVK